MKFSGILFLLATTLVLSSTGEDSGSSQAKCIERERLALLSFKQGLVDYDNLLGSWTSSNKDCCTWRGIRCDNLTNYVIMLDLRPNFHYYSDGNFSYIVMGGEMGSSLVELRHLEHLDLSYHNFTKIPAFIGSFTRLRYLNLSGNSIVGNIPSQLGNLTKLHVLDLSRNSISGNIPSELGNLTKLRVLDLSRNSIAGNIPSQLGNLTKLRVLELWRNSIAGNIPSQLGNLTKLRVLGLSAYSRTVANSFEWLSHLHSLRIFKLGPTNFTETMDWFQLFTTAPSLSTLVLFHCQFPLLESSSLSHINTSNSLTTLLVYGGTYESATVSHFLNLSNNLVYLMLKFPNTDVPFPSSFENLKSLKHLELYGLVGGVPKSLENLCSLQELILFDNKFNFTFEDVIESLNTCNKESLEILDLRATELQGPFPKWEKFPISLRELIVRENNLIGPLPNISKLSSLRVLDAGSNKLNGNLPESIGKLSNLEVLDVSVNSFTGVISEAHLANLSKLQQLRLSSNSLTLKLPFNWIAPFQLQHLGLASCTLGPQFPSWLQNQSSIYRLSLSSSGITNAIPNWFFNLTSKFDFLDLSFNFINSTLPNLQLDSSKYPFVDLSSNQFQGSIPPNSLFNASMLKLSNNSLTGFGPLFCTKLDGITRVLDLSYNQLSGSVPDCWFRLNNLKVLNLDNNRLSGVIPSSMASLYEIESLSLWNNTLSGSLPSFLKNCTQLEYLDVGENKFEGTIPTWIGERLINLVVLRIRSNKFHGMIPPNLCHLHFIQILDISQNNISGVIPSCFNNFTSMVEKSEELLSKLISVSYSFGANFGAAYYNKALVRWKGKEYEYEEILGLLRVIDLSSNQLIGEIPKELTNLVELTQLNLSRNNLSGSIPKEIGNLSKLESLDLSHNNLSGKISMGLAKISTLAYLDLSYNHLTGRIPTSTQLQSFNASSYAENLGLCGPPFLTTCPGDHETFQDHGSNLGHDDENYMENDQKWFDMSWFYIGIEVGFALGFIGVFGTLLFNSSHWRLNYFWCLNKMGDWLYVMICIGSSRLRRCLRNKWLVVFFSYFFLLLFFF